MKLVKAIFFVYRFTVPCNISCSMKSSMSEGKSRNRLSNICFYPTFRYIVYNSMYSGNLTFYFINFFFSFRDNTRL